MDGLDAWTCLTRSGYDMGSWMTSPQPMQRRGERAMRLTSGTPCMGCVSCTAALSGTQSHRWLKRHIVITLFTSSLRVLDLWNFVLG